MMKKKLALLDAQRILKMRMVFFKFIEKDHSPSKVKSLAYRYRDDDIMRYDHTIHGEFHWVWVSHKKAVAKDMNSCKL